MSWFLWFSVLSEYKRWCAKMLKELSARLFYFFIYAGVCWLWRFSLRSYFTKLRALSSHWAKYLVNVTWQRLNVEPNIIPRINPEMEAKLNVLIFSSCYLFCLFCSATCSACSVSIHILCSSVLSTQKCMLKPRNGGWTLCRDLLPLAASLV